MTDRVHLVEYVKACSVAAIAMLSVTIIQFSQTMPSTAAAVPCQLNQIHLSRGFETGAGGTDGVPFVISYSGKGTCTLNGYAYLKFYDSSMNEIHLSVYRSDLTYYASRPPSLVKLSQSKSVSFGIEFTQNLNQTDRSVNCNGSNALVTISVNSNGWKKTLVTSWPTGKIEWNYAIDWCYAGWRYGETAIEAGRKVATN